MVTRNRVTILSYNLQKVVLLNILEVFIGVDLELATGSLIGNDDSMGVHLQAADGPHMVDGFFDTVLQGTGLIMAVDHDHDLLGIHDSADANGQCGLGDFIDIVIKETTIGDDGIGGEGLLTGTALEAGAWLIEGDMSVRAYATHEQIDATSCDDGFLIVLALFLQILGIAVEDMDILSLDVDMAEEIGPHEGVVALRMILGEVDILVHIERDDILERHLTGFVQGNELSVHTQG